MNQIMKLLTTLKILMTQLIKIRIMMKEARNGDVMAKKTFHNEFRKPSTMKQKKTKIF